MPTATLIRPVIIPTSTVRVTGTATITPSVAVETTSKVEDQLLSYYCMSCNVESAVGYGVHR